MSQPPAKSLPAGAENGIQTEVGQIARGAGLGLGGNILFYVINFVFTLVVARLAGAESYGLYTLGVTTVTLLARFANLGLNQGVIRYISIQRRAGRNDAVRLVIVTSLLVSLVVSILTALLLGLYPELFLRLFGWSDKTPLLGLYPLFALALPFMVLVTVGVAGTQGFRTLRYRALIINTLVPLVKLLGAVGFIFLLGATAFSLTLAFAIAQILGGILAVYFLFRLARSHGRGTGIARDPSLVKELLLYSLPLLFTSVLLYLQGRTEIMVLGIFNQADDAGIYNAAIRFSALPLMVLTAFNAIFSPVIADLHHQGAIQQLDALFKLVTRWIMITAMPLLLSIFLFADGLMGLFGQDFTAGADVLRILSLGTLVNFSTGSVALILMMSGHSSIILFNTVLTLVVALGLDFLLIPRFSLIGAAVAGMLSLSMINLVNLGQVRYMLGIQPYNRHTLRPFAAAAPAALAGWLLTRGVTVAGFLPLLGAGILVAAIYLGALWLMGWDEDDRMMMSALTTRLRRLLPGN